MQLLDAAMSFKSKDGEASRKEDKESIDEEITNGVGHQQVWW